MCVFQANLLSSHRSLVHRVETIALGDKPCDRGEHVTLFLFNDCLEVKRHLSIMSDVFGNTLFQFTGILNWVQKKASNSVKKKSG